MYKRQLPWPPGCKPQATSCRKKSPHCWSRFSCRWCRSFCIGELLRQSVKTDGVINLFGDRQIEFSLFDDAFIQEVKKDVYKRQDVY